MRIQLGPSEPFNLDFTLCCGQTFRWDKRNEWWHGTVRDHAFKIRQNGNILEFENADAQFVKEYFGLFDDLPAILSKINKDNHVAAAIDEFRGLRILRQDPWECLISYICATYKNISSIKRMLLGLTREFGEEVRFDGYNFYTFPAPAKLANASENELAECGLGYRAKYVSRTAKMVHHANFEFEHLRQAKFEEAKKELLSFPGVGFKVADCILLFSIGKLEAFPVDVWIKRVVLRHYSKHFPPAFIEKASESRSLSSSEYRKLGSFGRKYFGKYAGYAQEYLYHYERMKH